MIVGVLSPCDALRVIVYGSNNWMVRQGGQCAESQEKTNYM